MKTLDLFFFGIRGQINGPKALQELEQLGVIEGGGNSLLITTKN